MDTGRKLNVHKAFGKCPGHLKNALCTFNLRPLSRGTNNINVILDQNHLDDTIILKETHIDTTVEMQSDGFQELDKKFQKYTDSVHERLVNTDDRIMGLISESNVCKSENLYIAIVLTDIRVRKVTLTKGNINCFFITTIYESIAK